MDSTFCAIPGIISSAFPSTIYDERLEIWSDGTLPFNLTPEDLRRQHESRPRNPLIAGTFYRRGLIEQWGRGTEKIISLCTSAGHPEPAFIEQAGSVGVRFVSSDYIAPHRVTHNLTERQRQILNLLAHSKEMMFSDIRIGLNGVQSDRAIRNDLSRLREMKLVSLMGFGRGSKWFLFRKLN